MSNFADGLFPRYLEFMVLLPFIMLGFGLWFIGRAFKDGQDARPPDHQADGRVVVLPDRTGRPLYHVHQQIRASARPKPKPSDDPPAKERVDDGRISVRRRHLRGHDGLRRPPDLVR
jgi:hypothetical protein